MGASLVVFLMTAAWYLFSCQSYNATMNTMMNLMMGDNSSAGTIAPVSPYFWVPLTTALAVSIAGVVATVYYVVFQNQSLCKSL